MFYGSITAGSAVALLARVADDTGAYLAPSSVDSMQAVVTDLMADTAGDAIALDPDACVYSTLQLTPQWNSDALGFNLAVRLDGSNFPTANTTYQIIVTIETATGGTLVVAWQLQTDITF